jgi:hypothetical protein
MFRIVIALVCLLVSTPAFAQTVSPPIDGRTLRASIEAVKFDTAPAEKPSASLVAVARQNDKMGTGQRVFWTSLAGLGGFFAGGYIGAAIEGDGCHCDDPGLKGALIGIPIGTAAAAITTWVLTGR